MKFNKYILALAITPLLVACSNEINFDFNPPSVDVDSISIGDIHRDTLTGTINEEDGKVFFDFYEISDFHGAVNYDASSRYIGLAKLGDYFSKKRAENPGGTIVLSSGDMFQGSAESNLTHGYIVNYSMNVMGFEAMTVGNHEFDWSVDWLKKIQARQVDNYSIPFLGANVYDKATGQILDFLKPSTVITRGDYKIGIIGTLGDGSDKSIMPSLVSNLEFKGELDIAKAEANRLRSEENCDIVIWSSHRDVDELAGLGLNKASGIDAVFGGHTHRNNPSEGGETKYSGDGLIPFTETENYGRGVAFAKLAIDKATKEVSVVDAGCDNAPYQLAGLVDHPEVSKIMGVYNQYIEPIRNEVIGSVDQEMDISNTFSLTDLCVDTMRLAANKWGKENGEIKVLAAFHNANGGVRANLPAGEIKFGSIYKSFPFDNEIILAKTKAKTLKGLLEKGSAYGTWRDLSVLSKWEDLNDDEDVYYTTTDFMATSKQFKFNLKEDELIRTGYIVRDAIAARIKSQGKIKASDFARNSDNPQFQILSRR